MRLILSFLCAMAAGALASAASVPDAALERALQTQAAHFDGNVAFFASDLHGRTAGVNADTEVPTASVIKLTVLFEAIKQVQSGSAHFDDPLVMQKADPVEGSGVLQFFHTPLHLTLQDALTMMVIVSDNTATNLVIDRIGLANVDKRIRWMGLKHTWLYKKVFRPPGRDVPRDQPRFGLGKTTPREMAEVMRRFVQCDLGVPGSVLRPTANDRQICRVAMTMLENQTDQNAIPRYLDVPVANKTGALDQVRNDVGVAFTKRGPIVISAFAYNIRDRRWSADNAALLAIGRMAKLIVDAWR